MPSASLLTCHFQMGLPPWARRFFETSGAIFETSGATWALLMDPGEAPPLPELPHIKWILRFYADEAVEKAEVEQGTAGAWPHYKRLKPFLDARPWLREWRFWVTSNNEMTNAGLYATQKGREAVDAHEAEFARIMWEDAGIRVCGYLERTDGEASFYIFPCFTKTGITKRTVINSVLSAKGTVTKFTITGLGNLPNFSDNFWCEFCPCSVLSLLGSRCPAAIAGFIITIAINSVNRVTRSRPWPYIGIKVLKTVKPAAANLDPPTAVKMPIRNPMGVVAPLFHIFPSHIFRHLTDIRFSIEQFFLKATARFTLAAPKISPIDESFNAAITSASPQYNPRLSIPTIFNNSPSPKSFPGQINLFTHFIYPYTKAAPGSSVCQGQKPGTACCQIV